MKIPRLGKARDWVRHTPDDSECVFWAGDYAGVNLRATCEICNPPLLGSGVCYCGADMEGHPVWDNHSPVERPMREIPKNFF